MQIKSRKSFSNDINLILSAALKAVDPYRITKNALNLQAKYLSVVDTQFNLDQIGKIFLIGFGKAVIPMARGVMDILKDQITSGVLVAKHISTDQILKFPRSIFITTGDHPVPTENSVNAARIIVNGTKKFTENDLVITLISGGGSSLVTLPRKPLTIDDLNGLTQRLLRSGASINEMNAVRKHLDQIKGGGLLKFYSPAQSVNLILSDVIGNDLSVIASGPTSPDPTIFQDAIEILMKYHLWEDLNSNVRKVLNEGKEGKIEETLKADNNLVQKTHNFIIGSLEKAVEGSKMEAEKLGYQTEIYKLNLHGEASDVGKELARYAQNRQKQMGLEGKPLCIIAGGETTVTVKGHGKGGRNQEMALAAALELAGNQNIQFVTLATDGEDGLTDAAGAIVDGQTVPDASQKGLSAREYLQNNDSYHFFKKSGGLIMTGPTGTNVNDLVLMFIHR